MRAIEPAQCAQRAGLAGSAGKVPSLPHVGDATAMIRNRRIRRSVVAALIGVGLLLLLAPSVRAGLIFFALGIMLELVGLALEHRQLPG
jgi:hypothetical protein